MRPELRQTLVLLALTFASVTSLGCSASTRRGETLYADGRYIEAAEVFERNEFQLMQMPARQQAEYGLYRGLTLLALGDDANAHRWMTYSSDVERAHPGSLTRERRGLLARAWADLQQRGRQLPPNPASPPTALAASQPPPPMAPSPPAFMPDTAPASRPVSDGTTEHTLVPR